MFIETDIISDYQGIMHICIFKICLQYALQNYSNKDAAKYAKK